MTDVASQGPAPSEVDRAVLTNRQGHQVYDNQNQRTVGARGPATLENYQFLEKISHFDRERIPERVVHARGFVCYGEFEATGKIGDELLHRRRRVAQRICRDAIGAREQRHLPIEQVSGTIHARDEDDRLPMSLNRQPAVVGRHWTERRW